MGKLLKLRSDMFFLMLASVEKRIIILTEHDMYETCLKEKSVGRVPNILNLNMQKYQKTFGNVLMKQKSKPLLRYHLERREQY